MVVAVVAVGGRHCCAEASAVRGKPCLPFRTVRVQAARKSDLKPTVPVPMRQRAQRTEAKCGVDGAWKRGAHRTLLAFSRPSHMPPTSNACDYPSTTANYPKRVRLRRACRDALLEADSCSQRPSRARLPTAGVALFAWYAMPRDCPATASHMHACTAERRPAPPVRSMRDAIRMRDAGYSYDAPVADPDAPYPRYGSGCGQPWTRSACVCVFSVRLRPRGPACVCVPVQQPPWGTLHGRPLHCARTLSTALRCEGTATHTDAAGSTPP